MNKWLNTLAAVVGAGLLLVGCDPEAPAPAAPTVEERVAALSIDLPKLCPASDIEFLTPSAINEGYVEFESSQPWAAGFSYMEEGHHVLHPASPGRFTADAVYRSQWGCRQAIKVGGLCVAHVRTNGAVDCCCSAAGLAKGGCRAVSPGSGEEHDWPRCPLAFDAGPTTGWSTSAPNLSDGTYHCGNTHHDAANKTFVQDCTRTVKGGYWQTVTILTNRSTHTEEVRLSVAAIRNAATVGQVTCLGTIPNGQSRYCWGKTFQHSSGTVQSLDVGGLVGAYSGHGGDVSVPALVYSPSTPILK